MPLWKLQAKTFNIGIIDYAFADGYAMAGFLLDQGHQPNRIPHMLLSISIHAPKDSNPVPHLPA